MKHVSYLILILLFSYSNLLFSQVSNELVSEKLPDIEDYIKDEMKKRKIPGLVYGIFNKDSLIAVGAYGKADIQNNGPVIPETVFAIASLTKQFTAAAILILQQDGKLNINDLLKTHFPQCPEGWSSITLKHLLTHTAGLTASDDYPGINNMDGRRVRKEFGDWSKQFIIDALIAQELGYAPGEIFQYGDPAYALLGIIIDNVTGSYRKFMKERIFEPVGMSATYIVDQRTIHPNEARGYTLRDGQWINNRRYHNVEIPSWYGIFSNIYDLQKWDAVLNSNEILSESSKKMLWSNYKTNDGKKIDYGLGWRIYKLGGKNIAQHNGITGTDYLKLTDHNISAIILTNLGYARWDHVDPSGITNGILDIIGYNINIDSDYITNNEQHIIPWSQNIKSQIIGKYKISGSWGEDSVEIVEKDNKVYLISMNLTFELGLMENGNIIHFGLPNEYILKPSQKGDYTQLYSTDGRDSYYRIN